MTETKEQFLEGYAARSGISVEKLTIEQTPFPCDCGDPLCRGWQMVSNENIEMMRRNGEIE